MTIEDKAIERMRSEARKNRPPTFLGWTPNAKVEFKPADGQAGPGAPELPPPSDAPAKEEP